MQQAAWTYGVTLMIAALYSADVRGQPSTQTPSQVAPQTSEPSPSQTTSQKSLGVGDPAPTLKIATWLRGEAITQCTPGRVCVVEFWTTTCPHSKRAIQRLSELSQKFAGAGVRVIGVATAQKRGSVDVEPFLTKQGAALTYDIACDDGQATFDAWARASGRDGVPVVFVVTPQGLVAWIGPPNSRELEGVIERVASGRFDIQNAVQEEKRRRHVEERSLELSPHAQRLVDQGDHAGALNVLEQIIAIDPPLQGEWMLHKFRLLAVEMHEPERAYEFVREVTGAKAGAIKDDADALGAMAWAILDDDQLPFRELELARRLAERANTLTGDRDPVVMDTLARAMYESGDKAGAAMLLRRAIELEPEGTIRQDMRARLAEYE